ncbi:unnamed protein product [Caenorhabditis nigoni]
MFFGYTVVAINRCSEIFRFKNHYKFWCPSVIFAIYFSEWLAPAIFLAPIFYTGNHNFSLVPSPIGGILMRADADFMKLDALQDIILSSICFLTSSFLYLLTFIHLIQQIPKSQSTLFLSSRFSKNFKNPPTDLIIFKCAFFSFVLFTPNFVKTIVLFFATSPEIVNIGTELWFFTTELMCISAPWSLLISSSKLREEFIPKKCRKSPDNLSTMMSTMF